MKKQIQCRGRRSLLLAACFLFIAVTARPQVGPLLWEENFNTLNPAVWGYDVGDGCDYGICGWGNAELQYYRPENAAVSNGTLKIQAKREAFGGRSFTSARLTTRGKITVQYGMIEVRLKNPNLANGLWPAFWMLGKSTLGWPEKGEIDMMEMGYGAAERSRQGHPSATVNQFVGANLFWKSAAACGASNPACVANTFYDAAYAKPYVPATSMADQFFRYRLYWTATQLRFTVLDAANVEHDLYEAPFAMATGDDQEEFRKPYHFLINMAVGGSFTGFLDPPSVTATMPATMEVDYVRVYQWNGQGTVNLEYNNKETGVFGVYTDNTPVNKKLTIGTDASLFAWNTGNMATGTTPPFEGANVIAWRTLAASQWFGGGVVPNFYRNMSNYATGQLKFRISIPANVAFKIGITSSKEAWVNFPANTNQYGLTRNGQWGEVSIPISAFTGIELDNISYMFAIASIGGQEPAFTFDMAIDDIRWEPAVVACGALPSPFVSANIGTVGPAGSACYTSASAQYSVAGSGADIWGTADAFRYVYRTLNGNGEIIARVASLTNTDPWAKAGVMMRESTAAGSRHAAVVISPANGVNFQWRSATGGASSNIQAAGIAAPYWVRLIRSGNTITASYSANGTAWTNLGSQTIAMATSILVGLPVTSHNNSQLSTAVFTNVQVNASTSTACGQNTATYDYSITGTANSATFTFTPRNGSNFVDLKYTVNGGALQAVRMTVSGANHVFTVSGLTTGNRIDYFFVYGTIGGVQNETSFGTHPDYVVGQGCVTARMAPQTGWEETAAVPAAEIFPNPGGDRVTVTHAFGANAVLTFTNAAGRQVFRQHLTTAQQTVNTSGLEPGVYMAAIGNAGQRQTLKFVKQ